MNSIDKPYSKARLLVAIAVALLFYLLAIFLPRARDYPLVVVAAPDGIEVAILLYKERDRGVTCEAAVERLTSAIQSSCLACRITRSICLTALDSEQTRATTELPIPVPSATLPGGVVLYSAPTLGLALAACQESERVAGLTGSGSVRCTPPNTPRFSPTAVAGGLSEKGFLLLGALVLAAVASWITCWLIVRYEHLHGHFSYDTVATGPQKFHSVPTARIGGVGLAVGILTGGAVLLVASPYPGFNGRDFGYLLVASFPAFLGGITEDITKGVGVLERLFATTIAATIGSWLLGSTLRHLGVPGLDHALIWLPFAIAFTAIAVSGVANAINIIDGYNGLASGFAMIVIASIGIVAQQVGDDFVLTTGSILFGALLGFFLWNWPKGLIFLGDGGAYLLGFLVAELSVLLVVRNPQVSPWFPFLLLSYPVVETLFSIYRKKFIRGNSPGHPDGLHLHMLVYKRLVRWHFTSSEVNRLRERNSLVAPYFWVVSLAISIPAILLATRTLPLVIGACLVVVLYIYFYRKIVFYKVPDWMKIRHRR